MHWWYVFFYEVTGLCKRSLSIVHDSRQKAPVVWPFSTAVTHMGDERLP